MVLNLTPITVGPLRVTAPAFLLRSAFLAINTRTFSTFSPLPKPSSLARAWKAKMEASERYRTWTKASLLSRIAELEAQNLSLRANKAATEGSSHLSPSPSSSSLPPAQEKKGKKPKLPKAFDFSSAPCRKIALRFSYDGSGYSGLAAQNNTPSSTGSSLPTVEGVLWDALCVARMVDPEGGMEGAGFSRCGRTDRGVSAAGQVVALWVRSKSVNQWPQRLEHQYPAPSPLTLAAQEELEQEREGKIEKGELPYVQILNRILPPSIRIQAWSPVRANFSARFDCAYRHYKYFFPSGPPSHFLPPGQTTSDTACRLDIPLMRNAASRLLGEHDFRNLCKVDASKQITNYRRRIDGVSIGPVSTGWPTSASAHHSTASVEEEEDEGREGMFVLNLRGTAFLYHQVRNIMAILFLVGAKLERPEVVEELMNVERGAIAADRIKMRLAAAEGKWHLPINPSSSPSTESAPTELPMWVSKALNSSDSASDSVAESPAESDESLEVYETKPNYEMAADRPLVLWECGFLPSDVEWRVGPYDGALSSIPPEEAKENLVAASSSLFRVHKSWTQQAISSELARHFVLAQPSPHLGTMPSRTNFNDAAFAHLPTTEASSIEASEAGSEEAREGEEGGATEGRRKGEEGRAKGVEKGRNVFIPLGNGTGRGAGNYVPLKERPREQPYEEKNRRWMEGTGKRRAERKAAERAGEEEGEGEE